MKIKTRIKLKYVVLSIAITILSGQSSEKDISIFKDFQMSNERYMNSDGAIFIKVHIWGDIGTAGTIRVYDGIDMASLFSAAGGASNTANLKKVRLYREKPDDNGQLVYVINFENFLKTGDRSNFIKIKPNDTIIVPTKISMLFIEQIGTINTLLSLITIYLQFANLFAS